jgi:hypothetical protein
MHTSEVFIELIPGSYFDVFHLHKCKMQMKNVFRNYTTKHFLSDKLNSIGTRYFSTFNCDIVRDVRMYPKVAHCLGICPHSIPL